MTWQLKLLTWYRKYRRDLPWRRTDDPYKIWVSEIMLQQTTVEMVIPYYEKFIKKFSHVKALAKASEEDVLKLWSGLGYYSRARNLHKAAQMIVNDFAGKLPTTVSELMKLPGIGRYTAGAIASIAFEVRAPILDGNVIRVLARLFQIGEDPKSTDGQKIFWTKAAEILPKKHLGDFNQALMELGATVCLPENPLCLLCPLQKDCEAKNQGEQSLFPLAKKKTVYQDVLMTAAVIRLGNQGNQILVIQRPGLGFLRGMWEVPMVEGGSEEFLKQWPVTILKSMPIVRHSVMNKRLKITPLLCELQKKYEISVPHRWILPEELKDLPTSSMNQKILMKITPSLLR